MHYQLLYTLSAIDNHKIFKGLDLVDDAKRSVK